LRFINPISAEIQGLYILNLPIFGYNFKELQIIATGSSALELANEINEPLTGRKRVALALQIGNEISYSEIGQTIGTDNKTIDRYVELLEKCFVVFQLGGFSRNLRNEIKKGKKIYFYDNGIRNSIIKKFSPLSLRQDIGALWENFLVSERKKANHYANHYVNSYFWRTHKQQEIDMIEETGGKLYAWEFKWNENAKVKIPASFIEAYPGSITGTVNRRNYIDFLNF
jgi:hypothetical protein